MLAPPAPGTATATDLDPTGAVPLAGSSSSPAAPPGLAGEGGTSVEVTEEKPRPSIVSRFLHTMNLILFHNWLNVLLVFVPVGIAVKATNQSAGVVFGVNAIAIVPLAGMLAKATETVAASFGDAIGALMNVTFGNAVELIIL